MGHAETPETPNPHEGAEGARSAVQPVVRPKPPRLDEIVKEYLAAHGFDGLYSDDECACTADDLFPCSAPGGDCTAGYRRPCDCGDHDFHIGPRD